MIQTTTFSGILIVSVLLNNMCTNKEYFCAPHLTFSSHSYFKDAKSWEEASLNLHKLYAERAPIEAFFPWRDDRVIDEILWYG